LEYLGSFGRDDDNFSFNVAALARPTIAGKRASPAAIAVDDLTNARRSIDVANGVEVMHFTD
jgi:hypothetical protein